MNLNDKRHTLISAIAEGCGFVTFYWNDLNLVEINIRNEKYGGLTYIGCVTPIFEQKRDEKPKYYEFQGTKYTILKDAVEAIEAYNRTLMFPPECYHPRYRPISKVQQMIIFYMKNVLNFSYQPNYINHDSMVFVQKNLFGKENLKLDIYLDHKWDWEDESTAFEGAIVYYLSGWQWLEKKFNSLDDFIKKIGGFVEPICLTENTKNCETLTNIQKVEKDYNMTANALNIATNTQYVAQVRNATKKALQEALKNIEEQEIKEKELLEK